MSSSPLSKTTAASIPKITELRNELDYGNPQLPRCMAFYDDIRVFRRKYRTSQGVPGVNLWDWKSREHQAGLTEMTQAYLDEEGNGRVFWPAEESSPNRNRLNYSIDHLRIKRLIKQLFFRLNLQQYRNNKYKHKDKSERQTPDERGHSVETAIEVDSPQPTNSPKPAPAASIPKRKPANKAPTSTSKQRNFLRSNNIALTMQHGINPKNDVYAGPESESSLSPKIRPFEAINRDGNTRRSAHHISAAAQAYSTRISKRPPTTSSSGKDDAASRKRKAAEIEQLASWSPRSRKRVQKEDYVGLEVINAVLDGDSSIGGSPDLSNHDLRATVEDVDDEGDDPFATPSLPREGLQPSESGVEDAPPPPDTSNGGDISFSEKSQPHFEPITTPSSIVSPSIDVRQGSEQPRQQPLPHSTTVTPGLRPASNLNPAKPSVTFIYRVIHSQNTSEKHVQTWQPRGRFQDKSLADLIKELPFDDSTDVRGLVFTIDLPGMQAVERILRDNEDGFESMKRLINRSIRDWFTRRRRSGEDAGPARLVVDVFIETMGEENKEGIDKEDDIDVTWW